jgi:Fe-S-cluster containining protein
VSELERQLERGAAFTHTVLSEQAERSNENEAVVNGLIDVLIRRGLVGADELKRAIEAARQEAAETGQLATLGAAIRVDGEPVPPPEIDCAARLPICQAACCRLRFALSAEDIEAGAVKWDLARPYYNRRDAEGYCHRLDPARGCEVYEARPTVCRNYSCAHDPRIWIDFEAMELNHEWIAEHSGGDELSPVELFMDRYTP